MTLVSLLRAISIAALILIGSAASAAAQGIGLTFGPTFSTFSNDVLDFDSRVGFQGGLFFGGNRDGVLGVQGELNWIRKQTTASAIGPGIADISVDYLQIPVLLRLNAGTRNTSGFALYGLVGPAFEVKVADEIEGVTNDWLEGGDVGLVFGGGIEVARLLVEGRYEKGLRRINNNFSDISDIKSQSFTILFGIRIR
ncbi:MAG TPA: outer membrane beta-barrel protein [Vicinamibacterales bacterium]|nr:outer membrane beta-barrel protein [Vicinamibacterales bacterium]